MRCNYYIFTLGNFQPIWPVLLISFIGMNPFIWVEIDLSNLLCTSPLSWLSVCDVSLKHSLLTTVIVYLSSFCFHLPLQVHLVLICLFITFLKNLAMKSLQMPSNHLEGFWAPRFSLTRQLVLASASVWTSLYFFQVDVATYAGWGGWVTS